MFRRQVGFAPTDRSTVITAVHDELVSARAKYPDDSTAAGHAISTALLDAYNKWVAEGSNLAQSDDDGYAKWTQKGALLMNSIRDIEGFAEEGTFSWVVKQTALQSAQDLGKLGKKALGFWDWIASWKGALVVVAVGGGYLYYKSQAVAARRWRTREAESKRR